MFVEIRCAVRVYESRWRSWAACSLPELAVVFKAEIEAFTQKSKAERNFDFWLKKRKNNQDIWIRKTNAGLRNQQNFDKFDQFDCDQAPRSDTKRPPNWALQRWFDFPVRATFSAARSSLKIRSWNCAQSSWNRILAKIKMIFQLKYSREPISSWRPAATSWLSGKGRAFCSSVNSEYQALKIRWIVLKSLVC